jgi:hypothetical protein
LAHVPFWHPPIAMDLEAFQRRWREYLTWRRRLKRRRRAAVMVLRVSTRKAKLYLRDFATLKLCRVFLESVDLAKEKDALMDMGRKLGCALASNGSQPLAA